jgi:peroxiredoxin
VALNEKMRGRPVDVVSINSGERSSKAEEFIDEHGAVHRQLNDPDRIAFEAYGVSAIPTTVVIDESGRMMFRHVGFREGMESLFEKEIETLLAWAREA